MPHVPTLSVALCTYNGAAFLTTQWESICQQTRLPDEVVVSDDASTDNTLNLLADLANNAPFRVRIESNPIQVGYNKNFEKALSLCTGNLIFLCDQDDRWFPEKINTLTDFMTSHPTTQMAFCNAQLADESLHPLPDFFWDKVRFDQAARQRWHSGKAMDVLLDGNRVMGCASVVRREWLAQALPIPTQVPGYIYDGWLALNAAVIGQINFVDQVLQLYRTHPAQQVGVRQPVNKPEIIGLRNRFNRPRHLKLNPFRLKAEQLNDLLTLISRQVPPNAPGLKPLQQRLRHYQMRSTLPSSRLQRTMPVLSNLLSGAYHRYADERAAWTAPYLAALGDLVE